MDGAPGWVGVRARYGDLSTPLRFGRDDALWVVGLEGHG